MTRNTRPSLVKLISVLFAELFFPFQKAHNLSLPVWANDSVVEHLKDIAEFTFSWNFHSPEEWRLAGGEVLFKPFRPKLNANSPNNSRREWLSDAVRSDCSISLHLSKLSIAKFSILYDISLMRDWKRTLKLITLGSERIKMLHVILNKYPELAFSRFTVIEPEREHPEIWSVRLCHVTEPNHRA